MQGPPGAPEIAHHEVVRALREGHAWLLRNGRGGALVVARPLATALDVARRRAQRLARASPGVAPVVVAAGGTVWALRPWLDGESLDALLLQGRGALDPARDAAGIAEAVAALHRAGVAHGRLHPGNLVLTARGWAAVDAIEPFRPLAAGGDPAARYAAPEVLRGRAPSRRADLFSLGLVVHAVHGGRGAVDGATWAEAARTILYGEVAPLRAAAPEVPARVDAAVARALSRNAWRRGTARGLARALREAGAGAAGENVVAPVTVPAAAPPQAALDASTGARVSEASEEAADLAPPAGGGRAGERGAPRIRAAGTPVIVRAEPRTTLLFPVENANTNTNANSNSNSTSNTNANTTSTPAPPPRIRRWPHPPPLTLRRAGVAALALASALAVTALARRPPSFAREVDRLLDARDLDAARRALREAERGRARDPLIEKLRGDLACAERRYGDCLRRYETALAESPALRSDARLRANALALLARADDRRPLGAVLAQVAGIDDALAEAARSPRYWARWNAVRALEARGRADRVDYPQAYALDLATAASCDARRAAARELARRRDPRVLPDLERAAAAARSSWAEWRCTGPEVQRALDATRAARLASR